MSATLPSITAPEIAKAAATARPITTPVEVAAVGDVYPAAAMDAPSARTSVSELLDRVHVVNKVSMCPPQQTSAAPPAPVADVPGRAGPLAPGAPGGDPGKPDGVPDFSPSPTGISAAFLWSYRIYNGLVLMFLNIPSTLKMLAHPDNAGSLLVPAIDSILTYPAAIGEVDARIFKKVDLTKLSTQKLLLLQLRDLLKIVKVMAYCLEAGITHVEQYLDTNARFVYAKLLDALGDDILLQQDLQALLDLVATPLVAAQNSRRTNAKGKSAPGDQGGPGGTAQGPGTGGTSHGRAPVERRRGLQGRGQEGRSPCPSPSRGPAASRSTSPLRRRYTTSPRRYTTSPRRSSKTLARPTGP